MGQHGAVLGCVSRTTRSSSHLHPDSHSPCDSSLSLEARTRFRHPIQNLTSYTAVSQDRLVAGK